MHELINKIFIEEFRSGFQSHILSKIYSMKFLIYFRLQIPSDWLVGVLEMVLSLCTIDNQKVLNGAALLTLEKILYMKNLKDPNISICEEYLKNEQLYMKLIECLTSIISKDLDSFAMKCFFRTVFLTDTNVLIQKLENFTSIITYIIDMISQSKSSSEQYSYYFFEAVAIIITKLQRKESGVYKVFSEKINTSVIKVISSPNQETIGYGFQLLSYMMYFDQSVSDFNRNLISNVLNIGNWDADNKNLYFTFTALIKISFIKCKNFYSQDKINTIIKIVNKVNYDMLHKIGY